VDDLRWFEPPLAAAELPAVMPSPFAIAAPHPLAARAAAALVAELRADPRPLDDDGGGKMFGVLVVADADGRVGWLRAFSGMLRGAWFVDGFAPPLFDPADRDRFWPAGEAALAADTAAVAAAAGQVAAAAADAAALAEAHRAARAAVDAAQAERKRDRGRARAAGLDAAAAAALDAHSRADGRARRELVAAQRAAAAAAAATVAAARGEHDRLVDARAARSRALWTRVCDGYAVVDARGAARSLASLYAGPPPGGAGDCAAPKLIADAYRRGLRPLALAELWWGPARDGRHAGHFYPACRGKCGPLLPAMLEGLAVAPPPEPGADAVAPDEPRVLHADAHVLVVIKPVGLLSVPGRSGALRDCVAARLRARDPACDGPIVVHRLDLDTSGLLLCARDLDTYRALQAQFARREVAKRYVAIVDGEVAGERGAIELPLRLDPDDRPRQVVDARHGKPALTTWEVLARADGRTRLALTPHTGRTHQLRVHCAIGLGAPIVGDRLYGRAAAPRLMLHAEALTFVHPTTGATIALTWPAPF